MLRPLLYIIKKSKYITFKDGYVKGRKVKKMIVKADDVHRLSYPAWIAWELLNRFTRKYRATISDIKISIRIS